MINQEFVVWLVWIEMNWTFEMNQLNHVCLYEYTAPWQMKKSTRDGILIELVVLSNEENYNRKENLPRGNRLGRESSGGGGQAAKKNLRKSNSKVFSLGRGSGIIRIL